MVKVIEKERDRRVSPADEPVARWAKLARAGVLLIGLWALGLQLVAGFLAPVAVIGTSFVAFAPFLRGERRRLTMVVGALGVVALLAYLPTILDELSHPDSGVAFSFTLLVTIASFVLVVAGLGAGFRWDPSVIRPAGVAMSAVFLAGLALAVVSSLAVESAAAEAGDVDVVASGNEFDPTRIVTRAGTTGFWLDNRDGVRHTLTVEGTDQELDVPGYSSQRADFDLAAGQYTIICAVPGHESMTIALTVEG